MESNLELSDYQIQQRNKKDESIDYLIPPNNQQKLKRKKRSSPGRKHTVDHEQFATMDTNNTIRIQTRKHEV